MNLFAFYLIGNLTAYHILEDESALIEQPKVPKGQNESLGEPKEDLLIDKIILLLRDDQNVSVIFMQNVC